MWTVGQTGEKKKPFSNKNRHVWTGFKAPSTRIGLFLRTENPDETKFSGDKNVRFRKRLQIVEFFENAGLSF